MFIDTANLDQVKEMLSFNQFEGVTTNPKLLLKEGHPRFEQLGKIRDLKPGVLFVQLVGDTEEELLADYHELRKRFPDNDDTRMPLRFHYLNQAIGQYQRFALKSPMSVC